MINDVPLPPVLNRTEKRRLGKELLGPVASHPVSRRLLSNYQKYGRQAAEIFTQHDDGTGKARYYDVFSARVWCSANCQPVALTLGTDLMFDLATKSTDKYHLLTKQMDQDAEPIIVCRQASPSGDQLIDGAHRCVAFLSELRAKGFEGAQIKIPAYVLEPPQWNKFVIPLAVAKAFRFDL